MSNKFVRRFRTKDIKFFGSFCLILIYFMFLRFCLSTHRSRSHPFEDKMRLNIAIEDQISSNAFPNTREDDNLVECFQKLLIDKQQTQQSTQNLDYITISNLNYSKRIESKNVLHFAFVGDSRIRQIFHLFVEVLPDNDRIAYPSELNFDEIYTGHHDVMIYSELLEVLVTFYWRPLLVDKDGNHKLLRELIEQWIFYSPAKVTGKNGTTLLTPRPSAVFLNGGLHHLFHNQAGPETYLKELQELVPFLRSLAETSRVVWLSQYPTIENFGYLNATNGQIHSDKIRDLNFRSEKIIRKSGILIWTSLSKLVEEYLRSCLIHLRNDGNAGFTYFSCEDFIHPGASVLYIAVQMIFDYICK